jgi:hypothetical protein
MELGLKTQIQIALSIDCTAVYRLESKRILGFQKTMKNRCEDGI